jgi:hypothetical protein
MTHLPRNVPSKQSVPIKTTGQDTQSAPVPPSSSDQVTSNLITYQMLDLPYFSPSSTIGDPLRNPLTPDFQGLASELDRIPKDSSFNNIPLITPQLD